MGGDCFALDDCCLALLRSAVLRSSDPSFCAVPTGRQSATLKSANAGLSWNAASKLKPYVLVVAVNMDSVGTVDGIWDVSHSFGGSHSDSVSSLEFCFQ